MDFLLLFKMKKLYIIKNKKSLSTVIATVLLILLVTVATAIVWTFVNNIVSERTEGVQSCFEVESSEKVTLNDYYTCYNSTFEEVQFSINIGDAEIDSLVISVLAEGNSRSFILTNTDNTDADGLKPYKGIDTDPVKLPGKNEGRTYTASGFAGATKIDWIKIAPIIEKKQCGLSDATYEVDDCSLFAS
ncbi:MAG: hypothetical protein AABY32_06655 [Nanoarchaeota archaeon]